MRQLPENFFGWNDHKSIMLTKFATLAAAMGCVVMVLCGFGAGFAMLAAAKLAVYINLYGPTVRRIWAAWVLGALLLASVLAAVRLFRCIPAARMAFVAAAFSFSLLCCLPLERFCVDAQLARPDCDWQLLQRYTWQSSELDEYITQQAGENANLSGRSPSILLSQDRSVA